MSTSSAPLSATRGYGRNHAVGLGSTRVSRVAEPSRRRLLTAACGQTKRCGSVRKSNRVRRDAEHGSRDARAPLNGIVGYGRNNRNKPREEYGFTGGCVSG